MHLFLKCTSHTTQQKRECYRHKVVDTVCFDLIVSCYSVCVYSTLPTGLITQLQGFILRETKMLSVKLWTGAGSQQKLKFQRQNGLSRMTMSWKKFLHQRLAVMCHRQRKKILTPTCLTGSFVQEVLVPRQHMNNKQRTMEGDGGIMRYI